MKGGIKERKKLRKRNKEIEETSETERKVRNEK
jgi:hypothetical protein